MADMTGTTEANWLQVQWSDLPTITYRSNVIHPQMLDRRWEARVAGIGSGKAVNIPGFSQNSAAKNRGAGTGTFGTGAAPTFDAVTESQTVLTVNRFYYKAWREPVEIEAQRFQNYKTLLLEGAAFADALQVDADIASDATDGFASFTTSQGTDNVDITEDDLLTVETNLNNAFAKNESRFVSLSPASRQSVMKIESIRNSLYKSAMGGLLGNVVNEPGGPGGMGASPSGFMSNWMTFEFWTSGNLAAGTAGKKNAAFQREAIAYAEQLNLQTMQTDNIQDGVFRQYITYMTVGFKKVKDNHGTLLLGK